MKPRRVPSDICTGTMSHSSSDCPFCQSIGWSDGFRAEQEFRDRFYDTIHKRVDHASSSPLRFLCWFGLHSWIGIRHLPFMYECRRCGRVSDGGQ